MGEVVPFSRQCEGGSVTTWTARPQLPETNKYHDRPYYRNVCISTDGSTFTVVDEDGASHDVPRGFGPGQVAAVARITVHNMGGMTAGTDVDTICLLDDDGHQVVTFGGVGWDDEQLQTVATAAGIRFTTERLHGDLALDEHHPRAEGWFEVRFHFNAGKKHFWSRGKDAS